MKALRAVTLVICSTFLLNVQGCAAISNAAVGSGPNPPLEASAPGRAVSVQGSDEVEAGGVPSAAEPARPETYEEFVDFTRFETLAAAIAQVDRIYLPPGRHLVDNPIVIDREAPLFLHGANRMATSLVGRNPGEPLILIRRAPSVALAGLRLIASDDAAAIDRAALRTVNASPLWLEIQDGVVEDSRLELLGPGIVRIQAVSFMPHGHVTAAVLIDHPDVEVTVVGGNVSNHRVPIRVATDAAFHFWQKRGRLRVFGTGLQAAIGPADVRIETPAKQGPHALIGVRSEGANGFNRGTHACRLLMVPSTPAEVDVVLESNGQVCGPLGRRDGAFVDYGARGTLWLIGNNGFPGAGSLVVGESAGARVFAAGNLIQGGQGLTASRTPGLRGAANLVVRAKTPERPAIRFASSTAASADSFSAPPPIVVPPALTRPRLTRALPGMLDAREFGAVGDGVHDDTRALQKMLDHACGEKAKLVFLPEGTYRVTDTLRFDHAAARCRDHALGGWIAGAGSDRTILRRDPVGRGGVFATQGMSYATVQGLTFRTRAHDGSGINAVREPAFALENVRGVGSASQGNSFHDVRFDGGTSALAIGVESPEQCSENLFVGTSFSNARMGLAVGAYNALANVVYGGRFDDNDITVGHPETGLSGGTWMLLGATIRGTRDRELHLRNSATGTWYANGVDSDTPRLISAGGSGAAFPVVFEGAKLDPRPRPPGKRFLLFGAGGGFVFLRSHVSSMSPGLIGGRMASSYLIGIGGAMPDTSGVQVGPNAVSLQFGGPESKKD